MVRFVNNSLADKALDTSIRPQVLALGLQRCATSSLQAALESLGYAPCMHMAHVQPSAERQRLVTEAFREMNDVKRRRQILSVLFSGFAATADYPSIVFADDLMDMFPDAPIILNLRRGGAAAWHKSFSEGLRFFDSNFFRIVTCLVKSDRAMVRMHKAADELYLRRWGLTFRDEVIYDKHVEWVRAEAKKRGRAVLDFTAEDGWGPLCQFLGKDIPSVPYPRMNDQKKMAVVKAFIVTRGLAHWIGLFALLWVLARIGTLVPHHVISFVKAEEL